MEDIRFPELPTVLYEGNMPQIIWGFRLGFREDSLNGTYNPGMM